jgi:DNA-binding transcriptional regulator WhiA
VKYGIALAKKDLNDKLTLALTNTADTEEEKLGAKIVSLLDKDEPMQFGILVNKATKSKNHTKEMVQPVIDKLLAAKMIIEIQAESSNNKQKIVYSYLLP